MFEYFLKNKEDKEEKEEQIETSIVYKIAKDGVVNVDVNMDDFSIDSMRKLCEILDLLSKESCYIQTLEIVKGGLEAEQATDCIEYLYSYIATNMIKNKASEMMQEITEEQPCIQPIQMLQ